MSDKIIRFDDALFGSAVIERCRRRESSVEEALMEMCLAGVSTRGVDDTGRLLWGERMPSRTLSDKLKKIHKGIDEWRKRPLESEYPYVSWTACGTSDPGAGTWRTRASSSPSASARRAGARPSRSTRACARTRPAGSGSSEA